MEWYRTEPLGDNWVSMRYKGEPNGGIRVLEEKRGPWSFSVAYTKEGQEESPHLDLDHAVTDLGLPASRTVRNECFVLPPTLWYCCYSLN